jgi:hypothetical protein
MKKGLIIIAAALFVAAMVLPAAALDLSISGQYRVRGIYQSNANQGEVTPWDGYGGTSSPDAWWDHNLEIKPVFKVADNLKLHTLIEVFGNQMWGSGNTSGGTPRTDALNVHEFNTAADNIAWRRAYIEWMTPKGMLKVGRMAGNYNYFTAWANTELDGDRIEYLSPAWNGFSFNAFYEKRVEDSVTSGHNIADEDADRYSLVLQYAQPCYYIGAGVEWLRDRTASSIADLGANAYKTNMYNYIFCLKANDPTNTYFFEGELMLLTGDLDYYAPASTDLNFKGWGYYANLGMRKGPLTVGLLTAFTSGDDNSSDGDIDVGPASGFDFQPLYIAYGPYSNLLNTTHMNPTYKAGFSNDSQFGDPGTSATGSKCYALYADYQVDPQLALHGALGLAYADKARATYYQDDEFGKELDLGLKYQIMSNLAYELHFGYLWTGDFFKGTAANNYDTDNIYQIDHSLTLSF